MPRKFTQYFRVNDDEWLSTEWNSATEYALTKLTIELLKIPWTVFLIIVTAFIGLLDKTVGNLLRFFLALCGVSKDVLEEYVAPAIGYVLEAIVDAIRRAWARVPIRGKAMGALVFTITAAAVLTNIYYTLFVAFALLSVWLNPLEEGRLDRMISPLINILGSGVILSIPFVAYFGFVAFWYSLGTVSFLALIGQLDVSSSEGQRRERLKNRETHQHYEEKYEENDFNIPMIS